MVRCNTLLMVKHGRNLTPDIQNLQQNEEMFDYVMYEREFLMLAVLILDPKSLSMDIDIYLRPLIDDLKDLWTLKGVETIDVATSKTFNMRAMLLLTINDFPARSSLSGWSGQGSWHALHVMKTLHLCVC
ncbi:reverse transcriptase domain-containing protein [Tanacetum coccineum]|uniref:Reverse transcriptase domain-containing protein n=1 Tax=Tanacetum coccineum TaxID=301880 RepID=A0ABQ4Z4Y9_9ASTR